MANTIEIKVGLNTKEADGALKAFSSRFKSAIDGNVSSVNTLKAATSGLTAILATLGGVAAFKQIAELGISLDKARTAMTALTGSTEKANQKLAELRKLAKESPGVTNTFATQLFQQLKAVGNIADETINKTIKSLGKLNTVFSDVGPEFARNLVQIFQQGFERADIKEALGRVPIFEQLLKQAFGTSDPDKLRKLKEAGKLTLGTFLDGFSEAINNDARFKNIQESLGGRLQKMLDETKLKLGELGEKLLQTILPTLDKLIPILNTVLDFLNQLPDNLKVATIAVIAMGPAINGVTAAIGGLRGAVAALGAFLLSPAGVAALAAIGLVTAAAGLMDLINNKIPANIRSQVGLKGPTLDITGKPIFQDFSGTEIIGDFSLLNAAGGRQSTLRFTRNLPNLHAPGEITPPSGGGNGGGGKGKISAAAKEAAKKLAAQIKEGVANLIEARDAVFDTAIETLDEIQKSQTQSNLETIRRGVAFPRQAGAFTTDLARRMQRGLSELQQKTQREAADALARTGRREFGRSDDFINAAIARGQLTNEEAELLRQSAAAKLAGQLRGAATGIDPSKLEDLRDEIALMDRLSTSISKSERFMRGFNSQIDSVGDAFERFGANVSRAFTNIRDLFNGLKQAVLGFFNDLLGSAIQNLVRNTLGGLLGGLGGRLGGAFGGLGDGTFGGSVFSQAFGGGGISAPASISGGGLLGGLFGGGGSSSNAGFRLDSGLDKLGFSVGGGSKFSFSGLGKGLAGAAPLLGLSLGSGLGGQSIGGQILGSAGGFLSGAFLAASVTPGLFSAGAAALFSNPFTAIAGVGLLVGSVLLGKAKQRKKDEEASGEFLRQALASIDQLMTSISSGSVDPSQAKGIFESQILGQFIQQINTLKTKSVRDSRLKNQVQDLRNVFESRLPGAIAQRQQADQNALAFSRQVPEFATGGTTIGGLALLHPGEKIVNIQQQARMRAMAGANIFERAGVPGIQQNPIFDGGGTFGGGMPLEVNLDVTMVVGKQDQTRFFVNGGRTPQGQAVIVKGFKNARTDKEL